MAVHVGAPALVLLLELPAHWLTATTPPPCKQAEVTKASSKCSSSVRDQLADTVRHNTTAASGGEGARAHWHRCIDVATHNTPAFQHGRSSEQDVRSCS